MTVHLKAVAIGCVCGMLSGALALLPPTWIIPALVSIPGTFLAVALHTPDIHGGVGFVHRILVGDFVAYFVVAAAVSEFWLRRSRS